MLLMWCLMSMVSVPVSTVESTLHIWAGGYNASGCLMQLTFQSCLPVLVLFVLVKGRVSDIWSRAGTR